MPERRTRTGAPARRTRESGFAIIVAIFAVIAGGVLATAATVLGTAQQKSEATDFLGALAFQAARDGVDYATYQAIVGDGSTTRCISTDATAPTTWSFTPSQWDGRLSLFIQCHRHAHDDGGTLVMYSITSTACNRATCPGTVEAGYVERQVRTWVEGPGS